MEKDKKKIIAGAAILGGAALAYALTQRKPTVVPVCTPGDNKCIGGDLYACSAQGQWEVSMENSPSCVAPPDTAILYGKVTDTQGVAIEEIQVACDSYTGTTEADGQYRIENIPMGEYSVTFTDPLVRYQSQNMTVNLTAGLKKLDVALVPTGQPADWSEGVTGRYIEVDPLSIYLGDTIIIGVGIEYSCTLPLPATIHGKVVVDGEELTGEFEIDFQNPMLRFPFTPTSAKTYTATALGQSVSFEVKTPIAGTIYSLLGTGAEFSSQSDMLDSDLYYAFLPDGGYYDRFFPYLSSVFPPVGYKGALMTLMGATFRRFRCNNCGYEDYAMGISRLSKGCPNCGYAGIYPSPFYTVIGEFYTYSWFGENKYLGKYEHASSCRLCGRLFYHWWEIPVGEERGSTYSLRECVMALYDHITSNHTEYPWDKPKGGAVLVAPGIIATDPDYPHEETRGYKIFGGIILPPGTYGLNSPYNHVEIPNWGDRLYINMTTGERALVTWDDMLNAP